MRLEFVRWISIVRRFCLILEVVRNRESSVYERLFWFGRGIEEMFIISYVEEREERDIG